MVHVIFTNESGRGSWSSDEGQSFQSEGLHWRIASRPRFWRPPTDFYETETHFVVRVEVAGMQETDFKVTLGEQHLQISGIRTDVSERRAYYQMEIPFGEFVTEVELPSPVLTDQVEAYYREGFLRVVLPKVPPQQVHIDE